MNELAVLCLACPALLLAACAGDDPPAPELGRDGRVGAFVPLDERADYFVGWESDCPDPIVPDHHGPCEQQQFTVAVSCGDVACSLEDADAPFVGEAWVGLVARTEGDFTPVFTITNVDTGEIVILDGEPVRARIVDRVQIDCFGPDGARCPTDQPMPAGQTLDLFLTAWSGDLAIQNDVPVDADPPMACDYVDVTTYPDGTALPAVARPYHCTYGLTPEGHVHIASSRGDASASIDLDFAY
jgi:hypothetical protein